MKKKEAVAFEETISDDWAKDLEIVEVPLGNQPLFYLGAAIFLVGITVIFRLFYLNFYKGEFYKTRAQANLGQYEKIQAPRGLIYDKSGRVLAENKATFAAILDVEEFLRRGELQKETLDAILNILYLSPDYVWESVKKKGAEDFATPLVLSEDLSQDQLVQLKGLALPTILIKSTFTRNYTEGPVFSSVLGYIGRVESGDLKKNENLSGEEFIGKAGLEAFYDEELRGAAGIIERVRDAKGKILSEQKKSDSQIGESLRLTIDSGFQEYFYWRLKDGLTALGRRIGVGLAINPQNGEVLALVNLPSFDNNILSGPGNNEEKLAILNSPDKPLFIRAVSGFYNPGSTIKPLVAVAALKEGVIDPKKEIFSPGYLDIPNPYNPLEPTRYLDWRYQGNVDMASAIAQSSNVYFYTVGGGAGDIKGLGIYRLHDWWEKFNWGELTHIDLPGEAEGFLPTPEWKENKTRKPWLLGDTYNVSIGQGDLLASPIQLLSSIAALANGGKVYEPVINKDLPHPKVLKDLSYLLPEIKEVEKGMEAAVKRPLGTAYLLHDLPFSIGAKTGSAQVRNNEQANAIFVGYAPASAEASAGKPTENPQIAILVLIENAREGSLNAVPIAKDVLNWYYVNRIQNVKIKM